MSNGIVRTIDTSDNGFAGIGVTTDFENLGVTTWCPVAAISGDNDVLTVATGGGNINVTVLDRCKHLHGGSGRRRNYGL